MREIVVITREELEEIIESCIKKYLPKVEEQPKQIEPKLLYSIQELADFLGCSTTTAL